MNTVCLVLALFALVAAASAQTLGEEKTCVEGHFNDAHAECKDKIPAEVKDGVEACMTGERDNGFVPKIKTCLNENGIADSSPCIKLSFNTRRARAAAFPVESEIMKPYADCMTEAYGKQSPKCDASCAQPSKETKKILWKCVKSSWSKAGDAGNIATCLNDVLKGQK